MKNNDEVFQVHRLVAETIVDVAKALNEEEPSGYLVYIKETELPGLTAEIGDQDRERADITGRIAAANACHLAADESMCLSSESHDDEVSDTHLDYEDAVGELSDDIDEISGGAVRAPTGRILSFAGFTEENNEVFMLATMVAMGWLEDKRARKILDKSPFDNLIKFERIYQIVSFAGVVRTMR